MRTNIEIDDKLMKAALKASRLETKTKKAVVEEALQILVRLRAQEGIRKLRGISKDWGSFEESQVREKDKWAESVKRSLERKKMKNSPEKGRGRTRKAA